MPKKTQKPKKSKRRETQHQQTKESNPNDDVDILIRKINRQIRKCTFDGLRAHDKIARSTLMLECLHAGCASMLIKRANALIRIRKREDAIKDAMKAIEYDPKSPEGYVTAYKIFIMQGKQQDAQEVIITGLRTVPPSNQQSLLELVDLLERSLTDEYDIMSKLPIEVILNIFSRLHSDMLYKCTTVSKYWRYVLTRHCPELWKTITLTNDHGSSPSTLLLPSIGNHIHSLSLRDVNQDVLTVLIDMAANHKLRNLSDVTLTFAPTAVLGLPMILLSLLRDKVSKLDIQIKNHVDSNVLNDDSNYDQSAAEFPLETLFSLCMNIKELSVTSDIPISYRPPGLPPATNLQLTSLSINSKKCQDTLFSLIPSCPRLERLSTRDDVRPLILTLLKSHCPSLAYFSTIEHPLTRKFIRSDKINRRRGIRTLQSQISSTVESEAILSVIMENAKTLTNLELEIVDEDAIEGTCEGKRLDGIELRRLESLGLKLCGYGGPGFEIFATIRILQCPALVNLSVDFNNASLGRPFFKCLDHQKRVQSLEIANVDATACGLVQYFRNMTEATLRHIVLKSSKTITDEVLYALAGTWSLRSIRISDASEQFVTEDGLTSFFRKLRSIPHLKSLYLTSIPYITDSRIAELAGLKKLRVLGFFYLPDITLHGVDALKLKLPALKTLDTYKCNNLDHNTHED